MAIKILMVCLGNICRSPLAEGLLASKLPKSKFFIDSAGTGSYHIGREPDHRSIGTAKKNGLDISKQKARQLEISDLDTFDYIYAMDITNFDDIVFLAKTDEQKSKVSLILNEIFPGDNVDVPDPYYGVQNGFDMVYEMLDEATDSIAKKLIQKHS
jgi:protein-tyrosine phosphatase